MPYHRYKDFVVQGAVEHHLPTAYIVQLMATRSHRIPRSKSRAD
jgi:hypothetical protein